jgi:integrase
MSNNTILNSRIEEYLAYRRSLGYCMNSHEMMLRSFARFVSSRRYRGLLKRDWAEEFADAPKDTTPVYRASRHTIVRDFARYWATHDPRIEVPAPRQSCCGNRRQVPYIYSDKEVQLLMKAARLSCPDRPFESETYATVIGLMAAAGLRTGEATSLRNEEVNLGQSLLYVRHGKNQQPRLTPVHPTTVRALRAYARQRDARFPLPHSDHFFLNERGGPVSRPHVDQNFRRTRQLASIAVATGRRQPRAYDLRHTFACNCLLSWLREGRDVSRSIHYLATYLGHANIADTYWYLSAVPALLELVGKTFERYAGQSSRRVCQ